MILTNKPLISKQSVGLIPKFCNNNKVGWLRILESEEALQFHMHNTSYTLSYTFLIVEPEHLIRYFIAGPQLIIMNYNYVKHASKNPFA